jgi:hypothetical protein
MGSVLVGLTACSDSSAEVDALRTQVEELQERLDAASVNDSAATTTPATTRAPSTTTTEAQSTKEERDRIEEEQNWIEEQLAAFIQGNDLITTRPAARCILQRFVDARGISGAEDLVDRVDADLNSAGRLSASDADAFLEPIVACVNLVTVTARDLQISEPDLDVRCMVEGLEESQVANWYRVYFVEGQAEMQAVMADWFFPRIPLCQVMTTTTSAPEVAKPPIPALPEFSSKKEWTEGDGTTWWRWCEDLQDWVDEHLPGRRIGDRCRLATALIKGHLSEHGWAKSCAIQYEHLDVLGREPDPYMCE